MGKKKDKVPSQTRFFAGITKNYAVAVCCHEENVLTVIRGHHRTAFEKEINRFIIWLDLSKPEMFREVLDGEQRFEMEKVHWKRLYIEVYFFLRGRLGLRPAKKKFATKSLVSRFKKAVSKAFCRKKD